MDNDLMRLRAQIDLVDQQILDLLSRRLKMAEQVAEVKPNGASVFRPDREAQLLARLCAAADPPASACHHCCLARGYFSINCSPIP